MIKICVLILVLKIVQSQISFSSLPCAERSPKIVGGFQAEKHEMPFIVSLMRRGGHFCGATIINEQWILTAGHCICNGLNKFLKPSQIQGVMGLHSISTYQSRVPHDSSSSDSMQIDFKIIVPHPHYQCSNVKNDIALIKLLQPIKFSNRIQPTCLTADAELRNHKNELAMVFGWGWTEENQENGERADILRKAAVQIWDNNMCEKSYQLNGKPNNMISDTQLCAGFEKGGIDSCWADSGGPLMSKENILIGVVSTGIGCARPGLPGIYTRVSKYIQWIESVILTNA